MKLDDNTLMSALIERGVLAKNATPVPVSQTQRPWFISALLGMAGWLAGLFVLLFAAMLFKPTHAAQIAPIGLVLVAAAFGLYAVDKESAFFDQLALALSIAGQSALIWAAVDATESDAGTALLTVVMQLIMLAVMPNRLAKVLAAFFACVAWALTIRFMLIDQGQDWRNQEVSLGAALLGWAIAWGPLVFATESLIRSETQWVATGFREVARAGLIGTVASLAIAAWLTEPFASLSFTNAAHRTNWLSVWPLLAFLMALYAALSAFRLRSRPLIGLAIAGALLHVSHFYYLLGTTLLIKSWLMLAVGGIMLIGSRRLQRGITQ